MVVAVAVGGYVALMAAYQTWVELAERQAERELVRRDPWVPSEVAS